MTSRGELVHWVYPFNPRSGAWLEDPSSGERLEVNAENVWRAVDLYGDEPDTWMLSNGFKTMRPGDCLWFYEAGARQQVIAMGRAGDIFAERLGWHVDVLWEPAVTERLKRRPIDRSELLMVPQSVRRANESAARVFDWVLRGQTLRSVQTIDLPTSDVDARTRLQRAIVERRGQARFRAELISAYGGRCAVTGCNAKAVLEAAHVMPYKGEHTNLVSNGILLRADLHTLFDLNLVTIGTDYRVAVSKALNGTEYAGLHGKMIRLPKSVRDRPSRRALRARLKSLE